MILTPPPMDLYVDSGHYRVTRDYVAYFRWEADMVRVFKSPVRFRMLPRVHREL